MIPLEHKPVKRRIKKDEGRIKELIKPKLAIMSYNQMSAYVTKELGYNVSNRRISVIVKRMKDEEEGVFTELFHNSKRAALNSFVEYRKMLFEAERLMKDSYDIEEMVYKANLECDEMDDGTKVPKEKQEKATLKAKERSMALRERSVKLMLDVQTKVDDLFKMIGTYQEAAPREDLSRSKEWQQMQLVMEVYFKYVLTCGGCGHIGHDMKKFYAFMEDVGRDPEMLNIYVDKNSARKMTKRQYEDAEYEDVTA